MIKKYEKSANHPLTVNRDSEPRVSARLHQLDVENASRRIVRHHVELDFQLDPMRHAWNILLLLIGGRSVAHDLPDQLKVQVVQLVDGYNSIAFLDATGPVGDRILDDFRDEKSAAALRCQTQAQA